MTLSISKYPRETNSAIQINISATSSCRLRSYTPRNPCLLTFDIAWINSAHSSDAIVRVKSSPLRCATLSNSSILLCGSFNNSTNLLISLYILFFSCNEFCVRQSFNPFTEIFPFIQLVISASFIDIQQIFVVHSYCSLLIVRRRQ